MTVSSIASTHDRQIAPSSFRPLGAAKKPSITFDDDVYVADFVKHVFRKHLGPEARPAPVECGPKSASRILLRRARLSMMPDIPTYREPGIAWDFDSLPSESELKLLGKLHDERARKFVARHRRLDDAERELLNTEQATRERRANMQARSEAESLHQKLVAVEASRAEYVSPFLRPNDEAFSSGEATPSSRLESVHERGSVRSDLEHGFSAGDLSQLYSSSGMLSRASASAPRSPHVGATTPGSHESLIDALNRAQSNGGISDPIDGFTSFAP